MNIATSWKVRAGRSLIACAVLGLCLTAARFTAQAQDTMGAPIDGTWIVSVSGIQSFTALSSFAAGGVYQATGSLDRLNPVSTLMGSWKRIPGNRFNVTAYFFAFNPANPNSAAIGLLKTDQVYRVTKEDGLVGSGDLRMCDLNGQNCGPSLGTISITGRRVDPEIPAGVPLP